MRFIDLQTQSKRIEPALLARFQALLDHGTYIMGPEIDELEKVLADFCGVSHAITVSSGTDALLIALMALGVKAGDEVITTPFSFFATAEVILLLGAIPVFVDIRPDTYNLDPALLEAAITPKTRAIMPVSLYGQCADLEAINAIAARYKLPVIEDAAQSFGATAHERFSCALSTIGCTSFFPSKPLGCFGDGGACFTNDAVLANTMKEIRVHGQSQRYYHTVLGINGRMDSIQAGILLEKMKIFPEEIVLRQAVAARYAEHLPDFIKPPVVPAHYQSVFGQYTIEVENRAQVQAALSEQGIPTAVHYPLGLHQQPVIAATYTQPLSFPVAERAARRVLSLPMHPYLVEADQIKICQALAESREAVIYTHQK